MFEKILVAIDKSEITNNILDATVEIANNKKNYIQFTLVNVSNVNVTRGMIYIPENYLEEMLNEMERESLEQLQQTKSKLVSEGILQKLFTSRETLLIKY